MKSPRSVRFNGNVLVLGSRGQVGARLMELLGDKAIGLHRDIIDLSDLSAVQEKLNILSNVVAVINAAAYTQVDKAESERVQAMILNRDLPALLARWCITQNIPFVHYSTDYVFSGDGAHPWNENDAVKPVNFYGQTKLEGEEQVAQIGGKFLIFRTSWVFDSVGKNFVKTILRLGQERDELKIVADQFGAPTHAQHLAETSLRCLHQAMTEHQKFPSGIYHCAGSGETNWHDFASSILKQAQSSRPSIKVLPITSEEFPTPAKRPKNSRLDQSQLQNTFGLKMPTWQQGLEKCLIDLNELESNP